MMVNFRSKKFRKLLLEIGKSSESILAALRDFRIAFQSAFQNVFSSNSVHRIPFGEVSFNVSRETEPSVWASSGQEIAAKKTETGSSLSVDCVFATATQVNLGFKLNLRHLSLSSWVVPFVRGASEPAWTADRC